MAYLLAGLLLFLGVHSLRIFADGWRAQQIGRIGPLPWKGLISVLSLAGFALLVWGWGMARQTPVVLWQPPVGMRHAASDFLYGEELQQWRDRLPRLDA